MQIQLLTIGRTRTGYIAEGIKEYSSRIIRYTPFELTELPDIKYAGKMSEPEQKLAEGNLILTKVTNGDLVVLLDERGHEFTSRKFAEKMQNWMASGRKRILFIIGGPYGFSEQVYARADFLLSMSQMTFNHEMVRLFFTEQVYRAMTILRNEPYHHD